MSEAPLDKLQVSLRRFRLYNDLAGVLILGVEFNDSGSSFVVRTTAHSQELADHLSNVVGKWLLEQLASGFLDPPEGKAS